MAASGPILPCHTMRQLTLPLISSHSVARGLVSARSLFLAWGSTGVSLHLLAEGSAPKTTASCLPLPAVLVPSATILILPGQMALGIC